MPKQYLYLFIDLACVFIPFLFSFHPKIRFDRQWRFFLPALFAVAFLFIVWDEWFTRM